MLKTRAVEVDLAPQLSQPNGLASLAPLARVSELRKLHTQVPQSKAVGEHVIVGNGASGSVRKESSIHVQDLQYLVLEINGIEAS
jgi:hypothetical protein